MGYLTILITAILIAGGPKPATAEFDFMAAAPAETLGLSYTPNYQATMAKVASSFASNTELEASLLKILATANIRGKESAATFKKYGISPDTAIGFGMVKLATAPKVNLLLALEITDQEHFIEEVSLGIIRADLSVLGGRKSFRLYSPPAKQIPGQPPAKRGQKVNSFYLFDKNVVYISDNQDVVTAVATILNRQKPAIKSQIDTTKDFSFYLNTQALSLTYKPMLMMLAATAKIGLAESLTKKLAEGPESPFAERTNMIKLVDSCTNLAFWLTDQLADMTFAIALDTEQITFDWHINTVAQSALTAGVSTPKANFKHNLAQLLPQDIPLVFGMDDSNIDNQARGQALLAAISPFFAGLPPELTSLILDPLKKALAMTTTTGATNENLLGVLNFIRHKNTIEFIFVTPRNQQRGLEAELKFYIEQGPEAAIDWEASSKLAKTKYQGFEIGYLKGKFDLEQYSQKNPALEHAILDLNIMYTEVDGLLILVNSFNMRTMTAVIEKALKRSKTELSLSKNPIFIKTMGPVLETSNRFAFFSLKHSIRTVNQLVSSYELKDCLKNMKSFQAGKTDINKLKKPTDTCQYTAEKELSCITHGTLAKPLQGPSKAIPTPASLEQKDHGGAYSLTFTPQGFSTKFIIPIKEILAITNAQSAQK